jgi:hypothetical protein
MCIVAVDFDGVIDANLSEARQYLNVLKGKGHTIVIWSTRNNPRQHGESKSKLMSDMKSILDERNIPYDEIDAGDVGKFHAQVYIDDKAIKFENNWKRIVSKIY